MRTDMLQKRFVRPFAIFSLSIMLVLSLASWTCADNTLSVTCYKDGSRIGTVTVFDWRKAASTCNMVLYDCRGVCIGCFRDFDYINNVCVDTNGEEFLR